MATLGVIYNFTCFCSLFLLFIYTDYKYLNGQIDRCLKDKVSGVFVWILFYADQAGDLLIVEWENANLSTRMIRSNAF